MKRGLQLVGGTVLGLALAEGLFWYADDGAFPHLNVYEPDATIGARLRPGASQRVAFGGNPVTSVRVNAEGYRGADWGAAEQGEIVVIGDSQVFGLGVEEDETASAALARATGRPVRNAGVPTLGPPEYLALLDELLAARKPATVVLVLNFANDPFEVGTPNTARHAIWDGWAVRKETMPADVLEFPGRQWLFSRSHLVHAARRAWWTPPEAWELGVPSEGTWSEVVGLAAARPSAAEGGASAEAEVTQTISETARERWGVELGLVELYRSAFPELRADDRDLAVEAAVQHAHPGDIVGESYAEAGRAIAVTAEQLREGARLRRELETRLTAWADAHPRDALADEIRSALREKTQLDEDLARLATRVAEDPSVASPLLDTVAAAKAKCDAAGAALVVVALPLDVQVSPEEWAKYGAAPQDMTATRVLLTDLVRGAERLGVRALDATDALAAAQPGAFLHADLHMSPKGQAALGAALAAKLAEPAPLPAPGPGLPEGRSRVPLPEEWDLAREIVVRGSSKNRCSTRRLREWLVVECERDPTGALVPLGVVPVTGEETLVGGSPGHSAVLLAPLVPGHPLAADFVWRTQTERLAVTWTGDKPVLAFTAVEALPAPSEPACLYDEAGHRRTFAATDYTRGCTTSFPGDCAAQTRCAEGTRARLPTCAPGEANAGSAGHCHALCDAATPCATGVCTEWQDAGVCL